MVDGQNTSHLSTIDEDAAEPTSSSQAGNAPAMRVDAHSALAQSRPGRIAIYVILTLASFWVVLPNVPDGPFRDGVDPLWQPAAELGVRQHWNVFSPNPPSISFEIAARIEYQDGTTEMWEVPQFSRTLGAYRQYRWRKWEDRIRLDTFESAWPPTAAWLAKQHERDGELPLQVTLVRRTKDHWPLGTELPLDEEWVAEDMYTWERDQ